MNIKETRNERKLRKQIKSLILFFMVSLIFSGLTAFPIGAELAFMMHYTSLCPEWMQAWLSEVYLAVSKTNATYPFLSYGTDWLAFAHLVIAVAFIGPLRDPIRNIWVIQFGMIACVMIIPLALIAGEIRGIPFFWQLIDCSFGVIGIIPLIWCQSSIRKLERLQEVQI